MSESSRLFPDIAMPWVGKKIRYSHIKCYTFQSARTDQIVFSQLWSIDNESVCYCFLIWRFVCLNYLPYSTKAQLVTRDHGCCFAAVSFLLGLIYYGYPFLTGVDYGAQWPVAVQNKWFIGIIDLPEAGETKTYPSNKLFLLNFLTIYRKIRKRH